MSHRPESAQPDVLASDAERDAVVARLNEAVREGRLTLTEFADRSAAVYAARKRSELDQFVRDLPAVTPAGSAEVARTVEPLPQPSGTTTRTSMWTSLTALTTLPGSLPATPGDGVDRQHLAIGAIKRTGRWRLPVHSELAVSLGPILLDLTEVELESAESVIRASTGIGTIKIKVPDHIRVVVEGSTQLGTRTVEENDPPSNVPAPIVRLRLDTGIGTVKVWVDRKKRRRRS